MNGRAQLATRLGLREQARRPLLVVLLIGLPFFFITRAIAATEAIPRAVPLPTGGFVETTMREIHGANMATITIAFLAGLCGAFVMLSAREADRRLIVAGFKPGEAIVPRLVVLAAGTSIVLAVSLAVAGLSFTPRSWPGFAAANLLIGLTYGGIGALAGALLGRIGATYFVLFLAMLDIGVVQNPMFGSGDPPAWGHVLPGYGAGRALIDASFSPGFHAWGELALALVWAAVVLVLVATVLRRALGLELGQKT